MQFLKFRVCNIVANIDTGRVIWLEGLLNHKSKDGKNDRKNMQYEPEIFPALIYRVTREEF